MGRRVQCANNTKQIALALQSFHEANQAFPANTTVSGYADTEVNPSWLAELLPYLDGTDLYARINFDKPVGQQPDLAVGQTVVAAFRCPSEAPVPTARCSTALPIRPEHAADNAWWISVGGAITNYKACAGGNWGWGDFVVAQTNVNPATDYDGLDHGNGIICRNWDGLPPNCNADVKDGLSNTFALGEAVAGWCAWTDWRWSNGSTATCGIPLNYRAGTMDLRSVWYDWSRNYSFFSMHPSGGNFALCDGGVRYINDSIDINVYRGLATIAAGETVGLGN